MPELPQTPGTAQQNPGNTGITPQTPVTQPGITPTTPVIGGQQKTPAEARQDTVEKKPLFKPAQPKTIQRGALATFQYTFWKHDPYPLILCSGIYMDGKIAGVNLHHLTFRYIKYLVQQYCGKQFSYPLIKNNKYIYDAFRTYKREGVRMVKVLDCQFLMTILGSVRSINPNEVEAIRQEIQKQLRTKMNVTADEMTETNTDNANG